jgi:hypothetical protein
VGCARVAGRGVGMVGTGDRRLEDMYRDAFEKVMHGAWGGGLSQGQLFSQHTVCVGNTV